ncbi:matrixin family metalloprotease [Candidatus Eisenbacteria bacterium]|uniref:Matrixin family metalloprotease n=1 Tax=Eiseniibacteriota bacterium TaxID=2212470 RepID=A0ABV6YPQ9_UNCEI
MNLLRHRSLLLSLAGSVLVLIPLFLASMWPGTPLKMEPASSAVVDLLNSQDPFDMIVREATLRGLALQDLLPDGRDCHGIEVCLHPDTDPADAERILRTLPTYLGSDGILGYNDAGRWTYTATDGNTGVRGDPITITWGVVPDGTWADGGSSNLQAVFTAAWGSTNWMNKMRNAFERWEAVIGITYVEVSDDGANMPNSAGSLGTRGDVRIGGRSVDGPGNVLGYDYYPNTGDMVLDTDDVAFYSNPVYNYANLKNVVMHEHGHGMGLGHVIPTNCTKLMEPYNCSGSQFVGPQDDDIRGGMRLYGDPYENNDTNSEPYDLGTVVDTMVVENLSIDKGTTDIDWYLVNLTVTDITIETDPVGSTYMLANDGGTPVSISTDEQSDIDIELYNAAGTTLLASATSGGIGETEVLSYTVPAVGNYQIKIYRKADSGSGCQRYTMTAYYGAGAGIPYADGGAAASLQLSAAPNPFGSQTTARFMAHTAGPYSIGVYDVSGRLAHRIEGHASGPGWVEAVWDGRDDQGTRLASGVYFMRANSGRQAETKRVLMVN